MNTDPSHHNFSLKNRTQRFKQGVHQLWSGCWHRRWPCIHRKPCVLVLGHAKAGKSQLIESFSNQARLVAEGIHNTSSQSHPVWWDLTKQAWLEMGVSPEAGQVSLSSDLRCFHHMMRYWHRLRWWLPLSSIVITIDLSHLYTLSETAQIQLIGAIHDRLAIIEKRHPHVPIHLVCTRSDLIHGFTAYCDGLRDADRDALLGVHLLDAKGHSQDIERSLSNWIDELNHHMIDRVYDASNNDQRQLVQEFPKQLEVLKDTMVSLTQRLLEGLSLPCHGIYLSSTEQKDTPIDYLAKSAEQSFALHDTTATHAFPTQQAFFSEGIYAHVTEHAVAPTSSLTQHTRLLLIALGGMLALQATYFYHMHHVPTTHQRLETHHLFHSRIHAAIASDPSDLDLLTEKMQNQMESVLNQDLSSGAPQTYQDLLTYLTLAGVIHQGDQNTLRDTLALTQPHLLNKQHQAQYTKLLTEWLASDRHLSVNPQLVSNILASSEEVNVGSMIYQAWQHQATHVQTPNQDAITSIYQSNAYEPIITQHLVEAVTVFHQIIERYAPTSAPASLENTLESVRAEYETAYKHYWENRMHAALSHTSQNFADAMHHIAAMNDIQQGWMHTLDDVVTHTTRNTHARFQSNIAPHFQAYAAYLAHHAHQTWMHLEALNKQLLDLQESPLPEQAAFQWAKEVASRHGQGGILDDIMQSVTQAPEPIARDIQHQVQMIWHTLLSQAHVHINRQWQQDVYRGYVDHIAGRFPFAPSSQNEVNPIDFENYFGPEGMLNTFFDHYIKAFSEPQGRYWTLQTIYGEQLPITQGHLEWFVRAQLIADMFFHTSTEASPQDHHAFALTLQSIPENIRQVTVQTGDQQATYAEGALPATTFHWPAQPYQTTLTMMDDQGQPHTQTYKGYWSLFRMLQATHAHFEPISGQIDLDMGLEGQTAHLLLSTQDTINPYIPHIMDQMVVDNTL